MILALFRKEASILNHLSHDAIVRYHVFAIDQAIGPALSGDGIRRRPVPGRHVFARPDVAAGRPRAAFTASPPASPRRMKPASSTATFRRTTSSCRAARSSRAKIIDFGIARSASVGGGTLLGGVFAGKYNFVSPEQLGMYGGEITEQSDIYSLGLIMAAVLRGEPLDMSGSQVDVIEKRRAVPDLSAVDAGAASGAGSNAPAGSARPARQHGRYCPRHPAGAQPTLRRHLCAARALAPAADGAAPGLGGRGSYDRRRDPAIQPPACRLAGRVRRACAPVLSGAAAHEARGGAGRDNSAAIDSRPQHRARYVAALAVAASRICHGADFIRSCEGRSAEDGGSDAGYVTPYSSRASRSGGSRHRHAGGHEKPAVPRRFRSRRHRGNLPPSPPSRNPRQRSPCRQRPRRQRPPRQWLRRRRATLRPSLRRPKFRPCLSRILHRLLERSTRDRRCPNPKPASLRQRPIR